MTRVRHSLQQGLTLVELVIVVVILGILAAVAIPNFTVGTDDAKISKASAIKESLKAAYAVQYAINKGAPSPTQIITGHDPSCTGVTSTTYDCANARVDFKSDPAALPSTWGCTVQDASGTPNC